MDIATVALVAQVMFALGAIGFTGCVITMAHVMWGIWGGVFSLSIMLMLWAFVMVSIVQASSLS